MLDALPSQLLFCAMGAIAAGFVAWHTVVKTEAEQPTVAVVLPWVVTEAGVLVAVGALLLVFALMTSQTK